MIIKNQVIAGFDRGAKTYTGAAHLQAQVAENLSRSFSQIRPENILEIGCGTGLLTQHLVRAFPHAHFLLTDISPSMIEHCHQEMSLSPNMAFTCMDGEKIERLPSFDLIASSMTLHWFNEFQSGLNNIKLKLNKGGRLIFAILTDNSFHEWRTICSDLEYPIATPHFPDIKKIIKQFPEFRWHVEEIKKTYPNAHAFLKTLKSLGATATRKGYVKLTTDKMRKLLRHNNHEIEITYEVVYGEYHAL